MQTSRSKRKNRKSNDQKRAAPLIPPLKSAVIKSRPFSTGLLKITAITFKQSVEVGNAPVSVKKTETYAICEFLFVSNNCCMNRTTAGKSVAVPESSKSTDPRSAFARCSLTGRV